VPVIVFAVLVIIIGGYGIFWIYARRRYAKDVLLPRSSDTIQTFALSLTGKGYSGKAISDAYNDLVGLCRHAVRAGDKIIGRLGIPPEEFEDVLAKRCREQGIPDVWNSAYSKFLPLDTVEDYVNFLTTLYAGANR